MEKFGYGMLTGIILVGLIWFFIGRVQLRPILDTTEAIRTEIKSAQSIGSDVSEGHNGMERTVASLSTRSETIESGATGVVKRSNELTERSNTIEEGLSSISESVRSGEKRYGLIVGVVGQLRDITETFRETIESSDMED